MGNYREYGANQIEEFLEIKAIPQLQKRNRPQEISSEIDYIARHQPQKLLGILKSQWPNVRSLTNWQNSFKGLDIQVPILDSDTKMPLHETYLPLPKLRAIAARLDLEKNFGFLQELEDIDDDSIREWRFLSRLGVTVEEDLHLWIKMLKKARQNENADVAQTSEIYMQLQRLCVTEEHESLLRYSEYQPLCMATTLIIYRSLFGVLSPSRPNGLFGGNRSSAQTDYVYSSKGRWVQLQLCVWKAPKWYAYTTAISSEPHYKNLEYLFKNVLSISPEPTAATYLNYLAHLKLLSLEMPRVRKVKNIYDVLYSLVKSDSQLVENVR